MTICGLCCTKVLGAAIPQSAWLFPNIVGDETSGGGGVNGSNSHAVDTGGVDTGSCSSLVLHCVSTSLFLLGEKKTARQLGAELLVHKCAWPPEQKEVGETSYFL